MMPDETTATIAAVSTPLGEGAIALVRLSGPQAIAVADQVFRSKQKPSAAGSHLQQFGEIVAEEERVIDQVMLSVHRAPASYTGEDVVEISCHGGVLVTARVWEACLQAGARAARPG
ncbi:MAG TPA: tRNA uridine-5-carboxymethylaminomethyl(34) synthesis GTPase MnmE, partial [Chthoniobacterales bacterium]|nr:tRNA uridine-5-carboxymethylaminomethyl(34) synthesis GTPase MnmE [Chthoniobacterales bacterium]